MGVLITSRDKSKLKFLDETHKSQVRLCDDKEIKIEARGEVCVYSQGKSRLIRGLNYAPGFAHNLISTGQLVKTSYSVIFHNSICEIKDKQRVLILQATTTEK